VGDTKLTVITIDSAYALNNNTPRTVIIETYDIKIYGIYPFILGEIPGGIAARGYPQRTTIVLGEEPGVFIRRVLDGRTPVRAAKTSQTSPR